MSEAASTGDRRRPWPSDAPGRRWFTLLGRLEDIIFTDRRLRFYGAGIAAGYAIAAALAWLGRFPGKWVMHPDGKLGSIDFCWIWAAGRFAVSEVPVRIYDDAAFAAAQNLLYRPGECGFLHQYVYPPTFLFFTWPLGFLPYLTAFAVWLAATFVLYEGAIFAIVPSRAALVLAATSPAVLKNIQLGHNGFLTTGFFGLALAFLEHRPWLAGIFIGLLTFKPQFGVLFPLALLASRNWRALMSAAAASLVFAAAASVVFGWQSWPLFLHSVLDRNAGLSPDASAVLSLQSVYGLLHGAGTPAWVAWGGHLAIAASAAGAVWAIWARPAIPYPLRASSLAAGAVLVSPYVLAYDLCLLSVAAAFLVSDGLVRGFFPGERTVLLVCGVALFLPAAPLAPVLCVVLLFLIARRLWRERSRGIAAVPANSAETGALAGN